MKTSWCLTALAGVTALCLLYVFQQTEVVKLGYRITTEEKKLEAAQDRHTSLEFSLSRLQSPVSIEQNFIVPSGSFEMPAAFRLVKVAVPPAAPAAALNVAVSSGSSGWRRFALRSLFSTRQAEARTVK
ncbi:MAG: hypothetical protein ACM3L6_07800 [Deltaproteobacteria bacterium]